MLVVLYPARGSSLDMFNTIDDCAYPWLFSLRAIEVIEVIFDLLSRKEIKRYMSVFCSHA